MNIKKIAKIAGAACAATGIVALGSVVASGAALLAVKEGFVAAKDAFEKTVKTALAEEDETTGQEPIAEQPAEAEAAEARETPEPEAAEDPEESVEESEDFERKLILAKTIH